MAKVLLFNITDPRKLSQLKALALRLNLVLLDVEPDFQDATLRDLFSRTASKKRIPFRPFQDEMLVFNGFSGKDLDFLLNEMNRTGTSVALKAVVTDTNQHWSASFLHHVLMQESAALNARTVSVKRERDNLT